MTEIQAEIWGSALIMVIDSLDSLPFELNSAAPVCPLGHCTLVKSLKIVVGSRGSLVVQCSFHS